MSVLVSSLVSKIRDQSGLQGNQRFSDIQIASLASDAHHELYDIFVQGFSHWTSSAYPFTITGSTPATAFLDLTLVTDLQMIQGVNWFVGANQPIPVEELGSYAERSQFLAGSGVAVVNGTSGRRYFPRGDRLELLPASSAPGDYELVYTPQAKDLALPVTNSFDIGDSASKIGSTPLEFNFPNAFFTPAMIGGDLVINFTDAFNAGFNGTYTIVNVLSSTAIVTSGASGASLTNPTSGTITTMYQPDGSVSVLPQFEVPYSLFITTHASIAIREARKQPSMPELSTKLEQQRKRATAQASKRSEGVTQAPRRNGTGGASGWTNWGGY